MTTTAFTNGVTQTDSAWFNDVDAATYPLTSVSGTNTVVASGPSGFSAYATGQVFKFVPAATNTGPVTLNVSSAGAKNVFYAGATVQAGQVKSGVSCLVAYNGTNFDLKDSNGVFNDNVLTSGAVIGNNSTDKTVTLTSGTYTIVAPVKYGLWWFRDNTNGGQIVYLGDVGSSSMTLLGPTGGIGNNFLARVNAGNVEIKTDSGTPTIHYFVIQTRG